MQFVPQKLRTITIFECLRLYILWFYCRLVVKVTQKKIFQNSLKDIARVQRHNISQWNTLIKSTLQFLKFLNFHNTIQSHFIPFDKQMQLFYLGTEPAKNMVRGFSSFTWQDETWNPNSVSPKDLLISPLALTLILPAPSTYISRTHSVLPNLL